MNRPFEEVLPQLMGCMDEADIPVAAQASVMEEVLRPVAWQCAAGNLTYWADLNES